jgi:hypothetical protein
MVCSGVATYNRTEDDCSSSLCWRPCCLFCRVVTAVIAADSFAGKGARRWALLYTPPRTGSYSCQAALSLADCSGCRLVGFLLYTVVTNAAWSVMQRLFMPNVMGCADCLGRPGGGVGPVRDGAGLRAPFRMYQRRCHVLPILLLVFGQVAGSLFQPAWRCY